MKILFDTNVLIAALIARGVCHELLEHCVTHHHLYTSDFILHELTEKLTEKFGYSNELAAQAVDLMRSRMTMVASQTLETPVCRDPDDDNILAAALACGCDSTITGDQDLLVLKTHEGINIFSPRDFLMLEIA